MNKKYAEVVKNFINCALLMLASAVALALLHKTNYAIAAAICSGMFLIIAIVIYVKDKGEDEEE